jgi:hypothetical protein
METWSLLGARNNVAIDTSSTKVRHTLMYISVTDLSTVVRLGGPLTTQLPASPRLLARSHGIHCGSGVA